MQKDMPSKRSDPPRRQSFGLAAMAAVLCLLGPGVLHADPAKLAKNVLLIAVDDLRPELGCYGHEQILSPNIDALAGRGMVFERAYCQQAVCAPSRSSLLSGCRPDTTKIYDLETPLRRAMPAVLSLPQQFRNHGYETVSLGKIYHHGDDDGPGWSVPPWRATGNWRGRGYFSPDAIAAIGDAMGRGPAFESADVADSQYPDGATADRAVAELRRLKGRPFFLAVGFLKPHLPFNAPKKYWDLYDPARIRLPAFSHKPKDAPDLALTTWGELRAYAGIPARGPLDDELARKLIHAYYACVSYVDAQIGRVLDELDRLELRDETVVVLWGDHGWKLGEYGAWCKHTNFELDTRAPLILADPGRQTTGARTSALVEFVDVYPTLCQLCRLPVPDHCEGTSMVPLLDDPARKWKSAAFSQYPRGRTMGYTMRTERYRYTEWRSGGRVEAVELYDHRDGPVAEVNLATDPAHGPLVESLGEMLRAGWRAARPSL